MIKTPGTGRFSLNRLLFKLRASPRYPKLLDYTTLPRRSSGYADPSYPGQSGDDAELVRVEIWSRGLFQAPLRIERTADPHCRERRMVADELLVCFDKESREWNRAERKNLKKLGLKPKATLDLKDTTVVLVRRSKRSRFSPWKSRPWRPLREWVPWAKEQARGAGFRSDDVEPNVVFGAAALNTSTAPTQDPLYKEQWDHDTICTKNAHADIQGFHEWRSENVIKVAVIDSGVDPRHEDLEIDHDLSKSFLCGRSWLCRVLCWLREKLPLGLIKALYWWLDKPSKSPEAYDDEWHSHGTACSAPIGAKVGNPKGLIGVGLNTKVVALKFMGADGTGTGFDASCAIKYALKKEIKILLLAWGGSCGEAALKGALQDAKDNGTVVVTAAGNRGEEIYPYPHKSGGPYFFPASYANQGGAEGLDNMLVVGGTCREKAKQKGSWDEGRLKGSNFSKDLVHLGAPGLQCKTTRAGRPFSGESHRYGYVSGTSAAAALVTGTCALVRLALNLKGNPDPCYKAIIQPVLNGAKYVPGLDFECCRRLDAECAVRLTLGHDGDCCPDPCDDHEQEKAEETDTPTATH